MAILLALLCFVSLVSAGYGLSMWTQQRLAARRDLLARLRSMAGTSDVDMTRSLLKDQRLSGIPVFDAILSRTPIVAPLVRMIQQAGLRRRVGEVLLYIPLLGLIGYFTLTLLGQRPIVRILVALALAMIPVMVVARMRRKRV